MKCIEYKDFREQHDRCFDTVFSLKNANGGMVASYSKDTLNHLEIFVEKLETNIQIKLL